MAEVSRQDLLLHCTALAEILLAERIEEPRARAHLATLLTAALADTAEDFLAELDRQLAEVAQPPASPSTNKWSKPAT